MIGQGQANPGSISAAWRAFSAFAKLPVSKQDISDDPMADALLFEFGTFDWGDKWGKTFEVDFVRQLGMRDGDLQQVHLVAHFPARVGQQIMNRLGVAACPDGGSCAARCSYPGHHALVGKPCRITSQRDTTEHTLDSAYTWSYDTGGSGVSGQRSSWIAFVASSPALRAVQANGGRALGYQVWRDSAD
jgi:hypothetical protein